MNIESHLDLDRQVDATLRENGFDPERFNHLTYAETAEELKEHEDLAAFLWEAEALWFELEG